MPLLAIWPTAATGLAMMVDEPLPSTAVVPLAFVLRPQPRSTVALPEKLRPVSVLLSRLMTQYFPVCTTAAVAEAEIVGVAVMKKPEKARLCWADTVTLTAL